MAQRWGRPSPVLFNPTNTELSRPPARMSLQGGVRLTSAGFNPCARRRKFASRAHTREWGRLWLILRLRFKADETRPRKGKIRMLNPKNAGAVETLRKLIAP
jgi:hypothetical protein